VGPHPAFGHPLPPGEGVVRVLLTRAAEQNDDVAMRLRSAGAEVVELPTIAIEPTGAALPELAAYAWVVFTSANGVRALKQQGGWPRIAVVGASTAAAAEAAGLTVAFRPSEPRGAVLGQELPVKPGVRVLLLRSDIARPELPAALHARGVTVDEVIVYRTVPRTEPAPEIAEQLRDGRIDAILLASPSAARGLANACGTAFHERTRVVAIGPTTAAAAREIGLTVDALAKDPSADGLIAAIWRNP